MNSATLEIITAVLSIVTTVAAFGVNVLVAFGMSNIETIFMTRKKIYANNILMISVMSFVNICLICEGAIIKGASVVFLELLCVCIILAIVFTIKSKKKSANEKKKSIAYAYGFFWVSIGLVFSILSSGIIPDLYKEKKYCLLGLWIITMIIIIWIIIYAMTAKSFEVGKEKLYYIKNDEKRYIYMAKDKEYVYTGKNPIMRENQTYFLVPILKLEGVGIMKDTDSKNNSLQNLNNSKDLRKELEKLYNKKEYLEGYQKMVEQIEYVMSSEQGMEQVEGLICYYESKSNNSFFQAQLSWAYALLVASCSLVSAALLDLSEIIGAEWSIFIGVGLVILAIVLTMAAQTQDKNVFILNVLKFEFEKYRCNIHDV